MDVDHQFVVADLIARISDLQSRGDGPFASGLFPAERVYSPTGSAVPDDSIFPTAVVVYLLSRVRDSLHAESARQVDQIRQSAIRNYRSYIKPNGDKLYNFWQTTPDHRPFPNSRWKLKHRLFRLPEDIDTTAYVYLTDDVSKEQCRWLKSRIRADTNLNTRAIRNTPAAYRKIRAYSTWLESVEMPVDFDVCALSNLLLFIFANRLPLDEFDHASIRFVREVVESRDYVDRPFDVAPWYAETALIIYHVARLLGNFDVPGLDRVKPALLDEITRQAALERRLIPRILLSTSAMRLGADPVVTTPPPTGDAEVRDFRYFRGSPLAGRENSLAWRLARYSPFQIRFRCETLNLALVVEHEVTRGK